MFRYIVFAISALTGRFSEFDEDLASSLMFFLEEEDPYSESGDIGAEQALLCAIGMARKAWTTRKFLDFAHEAHSAAGAQLEDIFERSSSEEGPRNETTAPAMPPSLAAYIKEMEPFLIACNAKNPGKGIKI